MAGFLRNAAIVATTVGLTWASAILYWRQTGSTPSGTEMLTYLGLLPAGLLGGGWMLRSFATRAAERALAHAEAAATTNTPAAVADGGVRTPVPARAPAVLAAAVHLPGDLTAEGWLAQAAAAPRPGLHPRLKDSDGLPIFAAFVADLPEPRALSADDYAIAPHLARAMALLEPVLDSLALAVIEALPPLPVQEERVVAGWRRQDHGDVERILQVECMVEANMPEAMRTRLGEWLHDELQQIGVDVRRFVVQVVPVRDAATVWERLQRLAGEETASPGWHLLLAACSALDPAVIERWEMQGRLYGSRQPQGRVPGEAAAGLLLARTDDGGTATRMAVPLRASLPEHEAVHLHGRHSVQLVTDALARAGLEASAVGYVISDAGAGTERVAEAGQVAYAVCPDLDVATQSLPLQASTGDISLAAPLSMLALAHAHAELTGQAVLVLGLDALDSRWAALLHSPLPSQTQARPDPVAAA